MLRRILQRYAARSFDHNAAQRYELESAAATIREAYPALLEKWRTAIASKHLWQSADDHWFQGDSALFEDFVAHVSKRKCLEIGSGPFGHLAPCWWLEDRTIIDPLAHEYRRLHIQIGGESWFDGMTLVTQPAEQLMTELVGKVDGFIVTRNALDHCEDWLAVMHAISQYAAPGCWLLVWTDTWHLGGHDEGHHNITKSTEALDQLLAGMGFEILKRGALVRDPAEFVEWGRIARKTTATHRLA